MIRAAFCLWISTAGFACAQEDPSALARTASEYLNQAAIALSEAEGARDRITALTATVQAFEKGLTAMREGLRRASLAERIQRDALAGHDAELSRLLGVLQTIERSGGTRAALHPEGPLPAIRAGMLAGDLVPALNARAQSLAVELEDLTAIVALQRAGEAQLEDGLKSIRAARLALAEAVSERTNLPDEVATDDAAMQALINSSETLRAFADALVTDSPWTGSIDENWAMPVQGRILRAFDEADAAGIARPGWVVATQAAALVTTPSEGTVRFAGDLPDFDGVTILEPRAGELLILAGLGRVFVRRGQIVSKGEPIGLMPGDTQSAQEILIETNDVGGQSARETLYIELRQGREAIDPASRFDPEVE